MREKEKKRRLTFGIRVHSDKLVLRCPLWSWRGYPAEGIRMERYEVKEREAHDGKERPCNGKKDFIVEVIWV